MEGGHCASSGLDRAGLQRLFAYWMLWSWDERALIPAVLYRLDRCNAQDVVALQFLGSLLATPPTYTIDDEYHSSVLANHIGLSELWNDPNVAPQALQDVVDGAVASLGLGPRMRARLDDWPRYAPDALIGQLTPTPRPMLMLEGELDPATTPAEAAAVGAFYNGVNQHYVLIPGAPHNFNAPTASGIQCTLAMFYNHALDPTAPIYDCIAAILPLSFVSKPDLAAYFGTTDMWENVASVVGPRPAPDLSAVHRAALRLMPPSVRR